MLFELDTAPHAHRNLEVGRDGDDDERLSRSNGEFYLTHCR